MSSTSRPSWITSAEAAARLGVKAQTLYAYTSRGLLHPQRAVDGRTSRYDVREVDALARRGRPGGRPARAGAVDVRITTGVTELTTAGPSYRGRLAADLVGSGSSFEAVAQWLWTGDEATWRTVRPAEWTARLPAEPGPGAPTIDGIVARAVAVGRADLRRADRRPGSVHTAARRLVGELVAAVPARARRARPEGVAATLFARLAGRAPSEGERAALDAALVLLADHDIAASTLAARVAASTHADVYHVVLAGLATVSGPLHGSASTTAYRFLLEAGAHGARTAVDDRLRLGERLPGFGHRVYPSIDPRYRVLVDVLAAAGADDDRLAVLAAVEEVAAERVEARPNIDLALAALTWAFDLPPTSGECVFAVARVAGWVAHALEEYGERPVRYRPMAAYVGPRSSAPPARS